MLVIVLVIMTSVGLVVVVFGIFSAVGITGLIVTAGGTAVSHCLLPFVQVNAISPCFGWRKVFMVPVRPLIVSDILCLI